MTFTSNPGMFPLGSGDLAPLTPDGTKLVGTGAGVVVGTLVNGSAPLRGYYTLSFRSPGAVTAPIRFDAPSVDVRARVRGCCCWWWCVALGLRAACVEPVQQGVGVQACWKRGCVA